MVKLTRKWCGDTHTQVPSQRRQRAGGEGTTTAAATAGATVSAAATEARLRETPDGPIFWRPASLPGPLPSARCRIWPCDAGQTARAA